MRKLSKISVSPLILLVMLIPCLCPAQGWNVEFVSSLYHFWGAARDIEIAEDYAYVICRD